MAYSKREHNKRIKLAALRLGPPLRGLFCASKEPSNLMYAVIFRAKIKELDSQYSILAARLRDLALSEYGCSEFVACTEGDSEIAISYWPSLEHIKAWHQDPEHKEAQALGKTKWYASYQVQITEVIR